MLTALLAVAVSASVYRIPIQVSDSLEILEQVDALGPRLPPSSWGCTRPRRCSVRRGRCRRSCWPRGECDAGPADYPHVRGPRHGVR